LSVPAIPLGVHRQIAQPEAERRAATKLLRQDRQAEAARPRRRFAAQAMQLRIEWAMG